MCLRYNAVTVLKKVESLLIYVFPEACYAYKQMPITKEFQKQNHACRGYYLRLKKRKLKKGRRLGRL